MAQGLGDADRQAPRDAIVALARRLAVIMHRASGLTAPSSAEPGNRSQLQHDNRARSNSIGGNSSSTERWV
jgi:hypothetical protein